MQYTPAESVIRNWLDARFPAARVVTETPDNLADVLPCIVVGGFGGGDDVITIDETNIDIQYFAATRTLARDGAEEVRGAMRFELPGQSTDGVFVLAVDTMSKPSWAPYDNTNVRRFIATYHVTIHDTF